MTAFDEDAPAFQNPRKPRTGDTRAQAIERARKLPADAGMPGERGIPEIEQDVQESTSDRQFFQASQRDFAEIGIRLKPYTSTWSEMISRINNGQAQMFGLSWGAYYPEAQNFLSLFYSPNAKTSGWGYVRRPKAGPERLVERSCPPLIQRSPSSGTP